MRTFQIFFGTAVDSFSETGAWVFILEEDGEVVFKKEYFELDLNNQRSFEGSVIHEAIRNLMTVRSNFRALVCFGKGQLKDFGNTFKEKDLELKRFLVESGLNIDDPNRKILLNYTKSSKNTEKLKEDAQAFLTLKLSTEYL